MALDIEDLLRIEQNRGQLQRLTDEFRSGVVIPFVGAGLSIPCGIQGWTDFLVNTARVAGKQEEIDARIQIAAYEEAAEILAEALGHRAFEDVIATDFDPQPLNLRGAVCLLPELTNGPVFTTNFDRVLETVYE